MNKILDIFFLQNFLGWELAVHRPIRALSAHPWGAGMSCILVLRAKRARSQYRSTQVPQKITR